MANVSTLRYRINAPAVVQETIDGEVVAVDLERGYYFSLRGVAADIWAVIVAGGTLPEVVAHLSGRYDGEPREVEAAVAAFVDQLQHDALIVAAAGDRPAVPAAPAPAPSARRAFETPRLDKYTDMEELLMIDPIHEVDERGWPSAKD
jgi:hypothetical protein